MSDGREDSIEALLAEQAAYYRDLAPQYERNALAGWHGEDLEAALESFAPAGDVLELACGTGTWTARLVRAGARVTALDASAEMLALARERVDSERVRFVGADLFEWRPDRRYDAVVFCFWLSHVPPERFAGFWALVARCLRPGGRVFFVDDGHRTEEEPRASEPDWIVHRRLPAGGDARVVKVAHAPAELERRLAELGWEIAVTPASGPFYWGQGERR